MSTITMSSLYSTIVMFLPTSSTPPSGMTRTTSSLASALAADADADGFLKRRVIADGSLSIFIVAARRSSSASVRVRDGVRNELGLKAGRGVNGARGREP